MAAKATYRLRERKSKFIEILRTSPQRTICSNFYVLSHANGCLFGPQCSYCYLKSSFGHLGQADVFSNTDRLLEEVRGWIAKDGLESYLLNSGNLSDSLAFEEVRPLMGELVETFRAHAAGRPHTLLLVTKGGQRECRCLFEREPCRNVTVTFSVNAPEAAAAYERGAAPVEDRLAAARRLKDQGWRIRMRIDPMLVGHDYAGTIDAVAALAPERVTLGTLRAEGNLPRYTEKGLFGGLEPPANSQSLSRYPLEKRVALYRPAMERLNGLCPVGLCEETPEVWDALGLDECKTCNCSG